MARTWVDSVVSELVAEQRQLQGELHRVNEALGAFRKIHAGGHVAMASGKPTISAAGRRRIAAAQRARWAKVRAAKKAK